MNKDLLVEKEISSYNTLRVGVWTNGKQGGDGGHGGRTVIEIQDQGSTAIDCQLLEGGVRIELRGDSELESIIEALEFAAAELRRQSELSQPGLPLEALPAGMHLSFTGRPSQAILGNGDDVLVLIKCRGGAAVSLGQALMALDINRDLQRVLRKVQEENGTSAIRAYLRGLFCDHIHNSSFTAYVDIIHYQDSITFDAKEFRAAIERIDYGRFGFPTVNVEVTRRRGDYGSDWYFDTCDEFYLPVQKALGWEA